MRPEDRFLDNVPLIERIAAFVCRRNHVDDDETADFAAEVKLRLIEDNYGIIRKFEERSTFSTYLTTVITRLFHQYRIEKWGKWRPSAEAKRLGDKAITLERMITRDGLSFREAVQTLTTRSGDAYRVDELESIYARLPARQPRPMVISDEVCPDVAAVDPDADEPLLARDRERTARSAASTIDQLLQELTAEDRLLLQLRFWRALKVPEIAQRLHQEQKKIYKRLDKLFAMMRKALISKGISVEAINALLVSGDQELHLDLLANPENHGPRPSHTPGGEAAESGEEQRPC